MMENIKNFKSVLSNSRLILPGMSESFYKFTNLLESHVSDITNVNGIIMGMLLTINDIYSGDAEIDDYDVNILADSIINMILLIDKVSDNEFSKDFRTMYIRSFVYLDTNYTDENKLDNYELEYNDEVVELSL